MNKFYKVLLIAFLLPLFSFAQSNYSPGYVITLKGDTLRGYINYKEWDNNPKNVAFKKELSQPNSEIFSNKTLSGFAITGQQYYERYVVPVSLDVVDLSNIGSKLDTSYQTDTVFLRILNRGQYATLYGYKDNIKSRFYLLEAGQNQPYELIYHAYYNLDESSSINYVKRFRTQLQNVLQKNNINDNRISNNINQSNYSETDLTRIVKSINGNSSVQLTPKSLSGIRWFAGAGANYSKFIFTGAFELDGAPASKNISPKLDAGLDFFVNKKIQKFYLRVEAAFTYGQYSFSERNTGGVTFSTSSLNLKLYNPAIIPQCVYNIYNTEQLKVFVDAGIAINFPFYNHYQLITKYDSFQTVTKDNYPQLSKNYYAFPLKAGIVVSKRLEMYVSYIPSSSLTATNPGTTNFQSNITSYQAGLNYFVGTK
jgi:hypothetical protein